MGKGNGDLRLIYLGITLPLLMQPRRPSQLLVLVQLGRFICVQGLSLVQFTVLR